MKIAKFLYVFVGVFMILSVAVYAATPALNPGYKWSQNTVYCYLDPDIQYYYGSSIVTAIGNGLLAWNGNQAPDAVITTNSSVWDVKVEMDDYGATGWDGLCTPTIYPGTTMLDSALIEINTYYREDYLDTSGLWQAIVCHEMGHAYGLGHNYYSNENSIMRPVTDTYYNVNGTPKWKTPRPADVSGLNIIY